MAHEIFSADNIFKKSGLLNLGLCDDELPKPLVLIFCEGGCEAAVEHIKYGVVSGGSAAAVINMPLLSDLTAFGAGKNSMLYAREAIADLTESLINIHSADGMVVVASSESAAAGMLMGGVRRNLPLIFFPAFLSGGYFPSHIRTLRAMVGSGKAGIGELESAATEINSGRSMEMDSLNSLCIFLEGCGLSVKNSVGVTGLGERIRLARDCGRAAARYAQELICPRNYLNLSAFTAGLAAFIAAGGASSALIHILALAAENHMDFDLKDVEKLSEKISVLVRIAPKSDKNIADFVRAGGTFAVLSELIKTPKLLTSFKICGETLEDITAKNPVLDRSVIAPLPAAESGGFILLKGSLLDYGVASRGVSDKSYKGEAVVFDSEDQFRAAAFSRSIKDGSVIILRGQGAQEKGLPLLDLSSAVCAAGLTDAVVITDGRALDGEGGNIISLCSGEALCVVKSGDSVEIDFKKRKANLNVAAKELSSRLKKINKDDNALAGGLVRYSALVGEPMNGCVLRRKF